MSVSRIKFVISIVWKLENDYGNKIYLIQIYVMLIAEKIINHMELVKLPIKQHLSLLHKKQGNIQGNYVLTLIVWLLV